MRNKLLHVTENQVLNLLQSCDYIGLARDAYIRLARKKVLSPERLVFTAPGGASFFIMPAHLLGRKTVTIKVARLNVSNPVRHQPSVRASVHVYDSTTGSELALMEGETLTAIRTAASSAVATDLLAPRDCEILGIVGTGRQARAHVPALLRVREFRRVLVYSRSKTHRKRFAAAMSKTTGVPVRIVDSVEEIASSSQVIVLATNSQKPVFKGRLVQPGTHVNAIGAALPTAREVDSDLVAKSFVAVDSIFQALSSYGDIMIPIREKRITRSDLKELGELLVHPAAIPARDGLISLFKSGGLAALDAAFADHIVSQMIHRP